MDFGYDEFGNPTRRPSSSDEEGGASRRMSTSGTASHEEGDETHSQASDERSFASHNSNRGMPDAESDFSDDVELVVGEAATQSIRQPLVDAAQVENPRHHVTAASSFDSSSLYLLEGGAAYGSAAGRQQRSSSSSTGRPLLLTQATDAALDTCAATLRFAQMLGAMPDRVHCVTLIGDLHHGKTSLLQMLLRGTRYQSFTGEAAREMTLKSHVVTLAAGGAQMQPATRLLTFVDTPGHPDFAVEVVAALRLADVALLCVDVVESLSTAAAQLLRQCILREELPVVLVLTKIDRLITDLKLPPLDAYRKMRSVIETVNNVIASCGTAGAALLVAPQNGTVAFASSALGCCFSLETFAAKYCALYHQLDPAALAQRLWGQLTFEQGRFVPITRFQQKPSFVLFVLEPLYKIVAHAATGKGACMLSDQLRVTPHSPLAAMQEAVRLLCGDAAGEGLDVLLSILPTAATRLHWLSAHYGLATLCHAGTTVDPHGALGTAQTMALAEGIGKESAAEDTTVVAIATLVHRGSGGTVVAAVRVLRGTLRCQGGLLAIGATATEAEPFCVVRLTGLFLPLVIPQDSTSHSSTTSKAASPAVGEVRMAAVAAAHAGQVVYVAGIGTDSGHHFVLVGGAAAKAVLQDGGDGSDDDEATGLRDASAVAGAAEAKECDDRSKTAWLEEVMLPELSSGASALVHVAVELKEPEAMARLQDGLQTLAVTTPGLDVHREETGEFTLTGFGEVHLDSALHELRRGLCGGVRLGLSQPYVTFQETVLDAEGALAVSGGRRAGIGCTSGALPVDLVTAVEYDTIDLFPRDRTAAVRLWSTLRRDYALDALDAQHIIATGPHKTRGPSLLINDTLEEEMTGGGALTRAQQAAIVTAFRSVVAAGPLIGDTVRGVAMRLVLADLAAGTREAQVLTSARTAMRHALLGARPRLLEPVWELEALCTPDCVETLRGIVQQRRGAVVGEEAVMATPLLRVRGLVPAMDSFGLETQIRATTHGQAYPTFHFAHWDIVPGDPFDAAIHVAPLEPAKGYQLARDFVLKTRFRRGLPLNLMSEL